MGEAATVTRVAIVGAGLSGLVVARRLHKRAEVTVFEKSRGPGGRMATRYAGEFEFDHGAQFFTARDERFEAYLQPLIDEGVVADWRAQFAEYDRDTLAALRPWGGGHPHYVGTPRMNSIGKSLAAGLNIEFDTAITEIARGHGGWTLSDDAGTQRGPFDWLVLTAPAAQTAALAQGFPDLSAFCGKRQMLGCFALMLGFAEPIELPWDAAHVRNADISWLSVNSSKPARSDAFSLVAHSTNAWADAHQADDLDTVLEYLLNEASLVTGVDMQAAAHRQVHRWRYANIATQSGATYFADNDNRLAACGDWCVRGRIEAAFTSASDLAEALIGRM